MVEYFLNICIFMWSFLFKSKSNPSINKMVVNLITRTHQWFAKFNKIIYNSLKTSRANFKIN